MLQIPELLSPAGDLERLRYAINYGADAVYCSLPEFGMRSAPANFTPEQLTGEIARREAEAQQKLEEQLQKETEQQEAEAKAKADAEAAEQAKKELS